MTGIIRAWIRVPSGEARLTEKYESILYELMGARSGRPPRSGMDRSDNGTGS
jgi:hypothetical protein